MPTSQKPITPLSSVAVVGGGLGGLVAATLLARKGFAVTVFEGSRKVGGRARSQAEEGFVFNQGPHAVYAAGEANDVLGELGIRLRGGQPSTRGSLALRGDQSHWLPVGPVSVLRTRLLTWAGKWEMARLFAKLPRARGEELAPTSVREWIEREVADPSARAALLATCRLVSYCHAPEEQSAGAALRQLQLATAKGVLYLDGGWQRLVDDAQAQARSAGVTIRESTSVRALRQTPEGRWDLGIGGDETVASDAVVLALPPTAAAALLPSSGALTRAAENCLPARAACLDLALRELPQPHHAFALGIDRATYFSLHSAAADLAPSGGATIHVARYLAPEESPTPEALREELEALVDRLQPGWRSALVRSRLLPNMLATNDAVRASSGGFAGRMPVRVPDLAGVWAVGDWVGDRGLLLDASLASARAAARGVARAAKEA